jgi:putative phosphoesterase
VRPHLPRVIVIFGDTHLPRGARRLPDRCVQLLQRAELAVHTGDFTSLAFLRELEELVPIAAVHGNVDEPDLQRLLPATTIVEKRDISIGVVHDAGPAAGRHARLAARFPQCGVVAYGHSHQPEITPVGKQWIVNPGSPTERRRAASHTVVVVDEGVLRLVQV